MHGHSKRRSQSPSVAFGDVVVIHNDHQPRGMRKLGKVEELLTGPNGEHRTAILQVSRQGQTANHLRQPVQRLYPLGMSVVETQPAECDEITNTQYDSPSPQPAAGPNLDPTPVWCCRQAATQTARDWVMAQALDSDGNECWPPSWSTRWSVRELEPFKTIRRYCIMSLTTCICRYCIVLSCLIMWKHMVKNWNIVSENLWYSGWNPP